ncbi:MAG: hypothetical protein QXG65_05230 [Thermoplasmata archaeon]
MADPEGPRDPVDLLREGTRDLFRPEEIVREAVRDIVKDEIRGHVEKTLRENPDLARDLREGIRQLLEARALEYAALLRVSTLMARLGLSTLPPELRRQVTRDIADLIGREIGQIVEKTL